MSTVAPAEAPHVMVEGYKVLESSIQARMQTIKNWFAQCCGLAAEQTLDVASYGGMSNVTTVEEALAIRIAGYRAGSYRSGYVICSTDGRQDTRALREAMLGAGFKVLDTFVNPAHHSGQQMTIWGAPTLYLMKGGAEGNEPR